MLAVFLIPGTRYIRERNKNEANEKFNECLALEPGRAAKWHDPNTPKSVKSEIIDLCNDLYDRGE